MAATFGAFTAASQRDAEQRTPRLRRPPSRVIELAEQVPPPSIAPVVQDADEILRLVRQKSDTERWTRFAFNSRASVKAYKLRAGARHD